MAKEKNKNQEGSKKKKFSRRKFLVRSGIGVGVALGVGYLTRPFWRRAIAHAVDTAPAVYIGDTKTPPIWFNITPDNRIILHSPKVEMGQGTFTSMAQMAAEELEVDMEKIEVIHAESETGNIDTFATGGSTSIASLWIPLRELAATMREMIKQEASTILGVAIDQLSLTNGVITGAGKSMTYGDIAKQVTEWNIPDVPTLKDKSTFKYIGKPVSRVDLKQKVMGAPIFGMDATMPEMLYGAVVRPEKIGAKFIDADISAAEGMPGVVKIVQEKDFVGVIANSWVEAHNAKNAIQANWKIERDWQLEDIKSMIEVGKGNPIVIQKSGKAKRILNNEENIITSEFKSPIGAHAQIEPLSLIHI